MKDILQQLVDGARSPIHGRNLAREYLQARILALLQESGAMIPLAFHGGTALRFLYRLPRHSEDLDFALEGASTEYAFRTWLLRIRDRFQREGYSVELKVPDERVVNTVFVRFRGLPLELGLTQHADEVLAVKIEVDTRPPAGAGLDITLIRRYETLRLQHHDRASLLAGKLHAILQRPYVKGRDLYDLVWYLSDQTWPQPNMTLLQNALQQTGWEGPAVSETNWRSILGERLRGLDWRALRLDVAPFLEQPSEVDLLTEDNLLGLLD